MHHVPSGAHGAESLAQNEYEHRGVHRFFEIKLHTLNMFLLGDYGILTSFEVGVCKVH